MSLTLRRYGFAVAFSSLVLAACGEKVPSASPILLPPEQTALLAIVTAAQSEAVKVENDMQLGGVKAKRDSALCSTVTTLLVNNWVGKVEEVGSNSDGKGVFAVSIARNVVVRTWNNAFSDIGTNTMLEPGSAIFISASALRKDDLVTFSGTFFKGGAGDCLRESSMTLRGKVREPDFLFKFDSIVPYSSVAQSTQPQPAFPAQAKAQALNTLQPAEVAVVAVPAVDSSPESVTSPPNAVPSLPLPAPVDSTPSPESSPKAESIFVKPSFDCAKATTLIEELICKDSELSALDVRLALAYRAARADTSDEAGLKATQLNWLKNERNKCTSSVCLSAAYSNRLASLSK